MLSLTSAACSATRSARGTSPTSISVRFSPDFLGSGTSRLAHAQAAVRRRVRVQLHSSGERCAPSRVIRRSSPRISPLRTAFACAFSVVSMCSLVGSSAYAQSRLQFTLAPGQFAVGFKAVDLFDRTREFGERAAAVDHSGGEHGLPLQVSIWYPAQHATNATRMRFREYAELTSQSGCTCLSAT